MEAFKDLILMALAAWGGISALIIFQQRMNISHLSVASLTDPLTGLLNRRALMDRLHSSFSHALRSGESMAVFLIDLNRFKDVNDTFGHKVGDQVLVAFAQALRTIFRRGADVIARHGGDEFAVFFPMPNMEQTPEEKRANAAIHFRRLVDHVSRILISTPKGDVIFTISVGGVLLHVQGGVLSVMGQEWTLPDVKTSFFVNRSAGNLLEMADKSMYEAKEVAHMTGQSAVAIDGEVIHF